MCMKCCVVQTIGWLVGKQHSSTLNAYMQWKPVCYTSAKPSITVFLVVLIFFTVVSISIFSVCVCT